MIETVDITVPEPIHAQAVRRHLLERLTPERAAAILRLAET